LPGKRFDYFTSGSGSISVLREVLDIETSVLCACLSVWFEGAGPNQMASKLKWLAAEDYEADTSFYDAVMGLDFLNNGSDLETEPFDGEERAQLLETLEALESENARLAVMINAIKTRANAKRGLISSLRSSLDIALLKYSLTEKKSKRNIWISAISGVIGGFIVAKLLRS